MKLFDKDRKPIENVQVSDRHTALRWIALAVCLIVAVVSIGYGLNALLTVNSGWQTIEDVSNGLNCADDFVVSFDFGDGGSEATAAYRRIAKLYSEAAEQAFWMFTKDQPHETITNVYAINHAPNTVLTVDPVLYNAFALVQEHGDRSIYLAPLYAEHDSMLACDTDVHAKLRDPAHDAEAAEYAARVAMYANDPQHVNIELLGNNQLRLNVSEEYLNWAQANANEALVDFHWMKNAFILDYFADVMTRNGFTKGTISSVDGFACNLGGSKSGFAYNLYDRRGDSACLAGTMQYAGHKSIVSLRNFPVSSDDAAQRYYIYDDGTVAAPQMCPADGLRRSAVPSLTGYTQSAGCAETLLRLLPVYTQESLDRTAVQQLAQDGVHTVWCEQETLLHTEEALRVTNLYTYGSVAYQTQAVK